MSNLNKSSISVSMSMAQHVTKETLRRKIQIRQPTVSMIITSFLIVIIEGCPIALKD